MNVRWKLLKSSASSMIKTTSPSILSALKFNGYVSIPILSAKSQLPLTTKIPFWLASLSETQTPLYSTPLVTD